LEFGLWQNPIHYVPFLSTSSNANVTLKLPPLLTNIHNTSQMQGMDRKYDGHVWCKVIITNIKNSFGLNFKKACCLGHLLCMQDDCEKFVHLGSCNEIFQSNQLVHILMKRHMALDLPSSSLGIKFFNLPPLCVEDYNGRVYYVAHRL